MAIQSVLCIATSRAQAEVIIGYLHETGFFSEDVSVLFPDGDNTRNFAETQAGWDLEKPSCRTAFGVISHGALDWLPAIGPLLMPGADRFIAAGPLRLAIAESTARDFIGPFLELGLTEAEARQFETRTRDGNILIAVHTEDTDQLLLAKQIFTEMAANDISTFEAFLENQSSPRVDASSGRRTH